MGWEELTVGKQFWVQARTEAGCWGLRIRWKREDVGRALLLKSIEEEVRMCLKRLW